MLPSGASQDSSTVHLSSSTGSKSSLNHAQSLLTFWRIESARAALEKMPGDVLTVGSTFLLRNVVTRKFLTAVTGEEHGEFLDRNKEVVLTPIRSKSSS